ncbi:serpin family protein [Yinghuangia aomiensis]
MPDGDTTMTVREYAGDIRELGSRWLDGVLSDPAVASAGGNAVCSPAGLWLALAAVACGAEGETADELADLLGVAGPEAAPAVSRRRRSWPRPTHSPWPPDSGARPRCATPSARRSPEIGFGSLAGRAQIDA